MQNKYTLAAIILICEGRQLGKLCLHKSEARCVIAANVCSHINYVFGVLCESNNCGL